MAARSNDVESIEKIAPLLAVQATNGMDKVEAARRLLASGFTAPEIGGLLDVGANFVNVAKSRKPESMRDKA